MKKENIFHYIIIVLFNQYLGKTIDREDNEKFNVIKQVVIYINILKRELISKSIKMKNIYIDLIHTPKQTVWCSKCA